MLDENGSYHVLDSFASACSNKTNFESALCSNIFYSFDIAVTYEFSTFTAVENTAFTLYAVSIACRF